MKTTSDFATLTFTTRYLANASLGKLLGNKYGIDAAAAQSPEHMASTIAWRATDWMEGSHGFAYAKWTMEAMDKAIQEGLYLMGGWDEGAQRESDPTDVSICEDAHFIEYLETQARLIRMMVMEETMRKIFAGTDGSSNPMTVLNSAAEVAAAKSALEKLCGMDRYSSMGRPQIEDIIAGNERRQAEHEAKRAAMRKITPHAIHIMKHGDHYNLLVVNPDGESIDVRELAPGVAKVNARREAKVWAEELRKAHHAVPGSGGCATVMVEG